MTTSEWLQGKKNGRGKNLRTSDKTLAVFLARKLGICRAVGNACI